MRGNICQRWRNALGWRDIACKDFTRFYRHHDTAAITEFDMHMGHAMFHAVDLDAPVTNRWVSRHGLYCSEMIALRQVSVGQCPRDHFQHIARQSFVAAYAFQRGFGVSLTGGVEFFPAVKATGQAGGDLRVLVVQ